MSHFTHIKTRFQNLFYLEKALNRLAIRHKQEEATVPNSTSSHINLVIPQSNGYDISFWEQPYPTENFIDRIAQQYAGEVVIGESQKIGFQPVKYCQNEDGSNTLVLERWSNKN